MPNVHGFFLFVAAQATNKTITPTTNQLFVASLMWHIGLVVVVVNSWQVANAKEKATTTGLPII